MKKRNSISYGDVVKFTVTASSLFFAWKISGRINKKLDTVLKGK